MIARNLTSSYLTTASGTKTHYLQGGNPSGPLLICLHGLGGSTETFLPLVSSLLQTHSVVLVDFPGFGKTPLTESARPLSIEGHVADLGDLIASLQGTSSSPASSGVVIIGQSLGAIVALHFAARYPQIVGGLTLIGTGRAAGHIPAVRQRMLDLAAAVRKEGINYAAAAAAKSNFYEDTYV
jgi:pimeloyl-ACP methyl ester carboxylesterase